LTLQKHPNGHVSYYIGNVVTRKKRTPTKTLKKVLKKRRKRRKKSPTKRKKRTSLNSHVQNAKS
jgi:hypothetical protein